MTNALTQLRTGSLVMKAVAARSRTARNLQMATDIACRSGRWVEVVRTYDPGKRPENHLTDACFATLGRREFPEYSSNQFLDWGTAMATWLVRGGREGECEKEALENCRLTVGFRIRPELTDELTWKDVWDLFREERLDKDSGTITKWTNQMWVFRHNIQVGDFVVMPHTYKNGTWAFIAIGQIAGKYKHRPESLPGSMHGRRVEWINKRVPPSRVSDEFRKSIGKRQPVFDISDLADEIASLI